VPSEGGLVARKVRVAGILTFSLDPKAEGQGQAGFPKASDPLPPNPLPVRSQGFSSFLSCLFFLAEGESCPFCAK
jgi:hypothetical protein